MYVKNLLYATLILVALSCTCNRGTDKKNKVFRMNISAGLTSLDPAFAKDQATMWCDNQLFNGLVQVDEQLNVRPAIAKSWTVSPDGLQYDFALRSDVYFHDDETFPGGKGRKVVAADFVYSLSRILDSIVASPGSWLFSGKVTEKDPFIALNDSTFRINLKVPFRPLLGLLTLQYCSVVPQETVEHYGKDFRSHPVGTGPFHFVRWEENNVLVLRRNPNYFETDSSGNRLPYIDGVRFSFIADKGAEFLQFSQGKLDFLSGLDIAYKDKLLTPNGQLQPEWQGKIDFVKMPYMNTEYLGISMGKQPNEALKNKKVRQAINYAIDRKKMLAYLRNGIGVPAEQGMIPKGMAEFDPSLKGFTYDPDKSRKLLAEAGYPDGKGVPEITIFSNPTYQDLITNIANELKHIGLTCKIENTPAAFLREAMRKNEVSVFRASWIGDYPDAENYLALFYSGYGAPPNYTFYQNREYDKLYEAAMRETDPERSKQLYHLMEQLILDDAPVIPLFYDEITRFTQKRVKGLPGNAMNLVVLKTVKLE